MKKTYLFLTLLLFLAFLPLAFGQESEGGVHVMSLSEAYVDLAGLGALAFIFAVVAIVIALSKKD